MRKQYHFRPGPDGLKAWDVDRLVASTRGLPVRRLPLSAIRELDEPYWCLEGAPTCREIGEHAKLINEADLGFPIILCAAGRVMDGMHRAVKAAMLGAAEILAVQFENDPEPDYVGVRPEDLPY